MRVSRLVMSFGTAALILIWSAATAGCSSGTSDAAVRITPVDTGGSAPASSPVSGRATAQRSGGGRAAVQPTPTPVPTPAPPRSVFAQNQVVSYYGNPLSATMGVLGEYTGDELVQKVKAQAAKYQAVNPDKKVIAALHLVYSVAQAAPGADGTYLIHMPDEMVEGFIEQTRAAGMLFFIDLQNGYADPVAESAKVQHWLTNEHVHLAVDPEFTLTPGKPPGEYIGTIDSSTINKIQDQLQETALQANIGNKILIVHQFTYEMFTNKPNVAPHDRVDVVVDVDGFGGPEAKYSKYTAHITNAPVEYAGIKLFYRWDHPLLTEAEIEALTPRPDYIVYQ